MTKKNFFILICSFFFLILVFQSYAADHIVERWGVFELTLEGPSSGNPYVDVQWSATFKQDSKSIKVPGFWDGGGIYKLRFSPPVVGQWQYETTSATPELNGKTGILTAVEPTGNNHGPLEIVNTFYFQYADGTPYHMLGTTSYQWTSMTEEIQQQTLESLSKSSFNKMRHCIFPKWYEHNNIEPDRAAFLKDGDKYDFTKLNPAFWQRFEQRILDMQKMGIEADIILWHPYDKWHDTPLPAWRFNRMGREADDRYLRYCIARLSAFRNVWWSLANEWEWSAHKVEDFEHFAEILVEEDPHQRLRGIHNGRIVYDQTKPWITHVSLQKHDTANGLKYRDQWKKPVVFDEYGYEGNIPEGYGRGKGPDIMKKTYDATFSGAYPTHGECFQDENEVVWWGKGGKLKGESWKRFTFLSEMLAAAPPFKELKPGNSMLVKEGEYYLVYCKNAGAKTIELGGTAPYKVELLDTWEMTTTPVGTASVGTYIFNPPKGEVVYRFAHYQPGETMLTEMKDDAPKVPAANKKTGTVFAANCGGGTFTSSDGTVYAADTGASGGSTHSSQVSISGTTDDALYQSERFGNCAYSVKVPNGNYRVILHFAETYHTAAGLRNFDVVMEGAKCLSGFDIYAKAGGNAAHTTETDVNISDGELNIEFVTSVENAKVNAIKVVRDESSEIPVYTPEMPTDLSSAGS